MFLRADTLPPHRTIDYIPHSPSVQCIKPAVCPKYEFIRKTRLFRLNPDIDSISFKYCRFMPKFKRSPAVSKRSAAQQKGGRFRLRPLFVCMKKLTIEYGFAAMRQCCRSVISLLCDTCGCTCQTRPRMRDYPSSFRTEIHACSYCVCPHQ